MARLSVDNVSVHYPTPRGVVHALDKVSLEIASGDVVVALGASGCGKSTLLGLMAGFQRPDAGSVTLDGAPITGAGAERGVVFQDDALMPWLSAAENVAFGLTLQKVGRSERRERAEALMRQVGLAGFEDHRIGELSGGMRQRLGLARALANRPDFLLMDEPLGALDALTRERIQSLILDIWRGTGTGIFLITHSIEEALFLATELVILSPRPGRIVRRLQPGFARRYAAGESARSIKADPDFVRAREDILNAHFAYDEEIEHAAH
ncbi:taurine ABC transporter ATP-binding protein [Crenobacter sp. SG2305]|uniref:taurine ABC transporter ATP-binding protein n=1 Tax=Crenobacter oryzisoli TaxID=3056844 RepID=UPI0025AAD90C|nr:taurine ABC transporter ATP-binding protein [Crenobacter sp. SG2305]MDN0083571.1 taurine ABC transporter ATP-binding protein [Crenobacter sp. SG2305]